MVNRISKDYILGSQDEELFRLGFQHRVWCKEAHDLWRRAGFEYGQTILDLGCGPGFAAVELAQLVGPNGKIIAIDTSGKYLSYLETLKKVLWLDNIETHQADLHDLALPKGSADGAYARWVMCFVKNPAAVIKRVAQSLRSGGVFAINDYFNVDYKLVPACLAFEKVLEGVRQWWKTNGGDIHIQEKLPSLLVEAGFEIREIVPITRVANSGSTLWHWPETFYRIFTPKMVELGLLAAADEKQFWRDWEERKTNPNAYLMTPPFWDIVAVKK